MNETYFKYHQGLIEMYDRLLFLTIQDKIESSSSSDIVHHSKFVSTSSRNKISSTGASVNKIHTTGRLQRRPVPSQTGPHETCNYKMLIVCSRDLNLIVKYFFVK